MKRCFFSAAFFLLQHAVYAEEFTVLCLGSASGQPQSKTFKIDFAKKTVDGRPAQTTDTEIKWLTISTVGGRVRYWDHQMNRISGIYSMVERTNEIRYGVPTSFRCEKALAPKF